MPWLSLHNPCINWHTCTITLWSLNCRSVCFQVPVHFTSVERFLGLYISVASSFATLALWPHRSLPSWGEDHAFEELKLRLITAPILHLPDSEKPFVLKVDALGAGVGVILSQHHCKPPKLLPCAFFFRKLTSAERNYDLGNQELLAVKLELIPLHSHHWSKNLLYIQALKQLTPQQARWALFFLFWFHRHMPTWLKKFKSWLSFSDSRHWKSH